MCMNIMRITSLVVLFVCFGRAVQCTEHNENVPQPLSASDGQWVLQSEYSDEFNEKSLDSKKWDNDAKDWGVWSWEPENAWVEDGRFHLRMQYQEHERGGKKLFYKSGIIKSKATPIRYGYFEARIKAAPRYPGVCPAFWAYRGEKNLWTEIDFVELTQRKSVKLIDTNTHVFLHPKLPIGKRLRERHTWEAPWDSRDAFHVYGCEWNATDIKWYVDGKLVNTRKNEYWHQTLDVVLSFGVRHPLRSEPSDKDFPTEFQVDYVRVWKKNTPNKPEAGDDK